MCRQTGAADIAVLVAAGRKLPEDPPAPAGPVPVGDLIADYLCSVDVPAPLVPYLAAAGLMIQPAA